MQSPWIVVLATHPHLLPGWLQAPVWLLPAGRFVRAVVTAHPGFGLAAVIFGEELGIPLPVPGDIAIITSGYLVAAGRLPYLGAVAAVMGGATAGSFLLFNLSRRFGHRLLARYGRFIGLDARRLATAERAIQRWGPWAVVVGRHIPGMRVVLSVLSGSFGMKARVFVPSVLFSSLIWALYLVEIGRQLGRRSLGLFRLLPGHLLPYLVLVAAGAVIAYHVLERRRAARQERKSVPNLVES